MYKYLLFDADNTLLDFNGAEAQALRETMSLCPLGFTDEIHQRYHLINDLLWKKLEKGEITREKLRVERFKRLYDEFGMDGELYAAKTADIYAVRLSEQGRMIDGAIDVLSHLSDKYSCYIITNGTYEIQVKRLSKTPIENYVKHCFISERLGFSKPSPIFFQKVVEYIGDTDLSRYLVIGDSMTSDIAGAVGAGMDSVLISPENNDTPTYCISEIRELLSIL